MGGGPLTHLGAVLLLGSVSVLTLPCKRAGGMSSEPTFFFFF